MADGTTTIDDLQIEIGAKAQTANDAIDRLVTKLDRLQTSLSKVNGSQLTGLATGVDRLGKSMQVMNTIKTADFTRLATNLTKLGSINVSALNSSASSLSHLSRALNTLNSANFDNKNLQNLINSITRLSNANVGNLSNVDFSKIGNSINQLATSLSNAPKIQQSIISMTNAVSNLSKFAQNIPIASSSLGDLGKSLNAFMSSVSSAPSVSENVIYFAQAIGTLSNAGTKAGVTAQNLSALGVGLVDLMTTLSKAPNVNKNIIDMTNALANLATQGAKVGSASKSIEKGLNRANNSATRASKSFGGLASAIGRFYATYFMVIRGIKGLYKSIEGTADYLEAFNYFNVALGKIGSDWSHQFEQYGYESAEAYADSFSTRLQSSLKNLSGLQITLDTNGNGLLTETGLKNLGLNIQEITQYASQLASVTNSVGQVGEVSLAAANSLTKLGADLSSLFNLDYSSVMNNLQSGLIGQSRALYKYGIDITNATLQTYAYELGLEKAVSEMTQAEKMQLRLIAILDQSKVSWGDLANTINSPSNMIRQFKNNLKEVGMVLGQLFIPLMQKVMPVINGVTIALKRLLVSIAGFLGIQLDLSSFGQGYSNMGEDVDGLTDSLDNATASAKKLKTVTLGIDELSINAPQDQSGASTDGVGGGIDLTDEILKATEEYEKVWNNAFANMENKAQKWANRIEKIFEPLAKPLKGLFESISIGDWFGAGQNVSNIVSGIFDLFSIAIKKVDWKKIGNSIGKFLEGINWTEAFESVGKFMWEGINASFDLYKETFNAAPLETALITAFAGLSFFGVTKTLSSKLKDIFITAFGTLVAFLKTKEGLAYLFSIANPGMIGELGITIEQLLEGTFLDTKTWTGIPKKINDFFNKILDYIGIGIKNIALGLGNLIAGLLSFKKTEALWKEIKSNFEAGGIYIFHGIIEGFMLPFYMIYEAVENFFSTIWNALCDVLGIHSPAETMKPIGENILLGIVKGFVDNIFVFNNTMSNFFKNTVSPWFDVKKWANLGINASLSLLNGISKGFSDKNDEVKGNARKSGYAIVDGLLDALNLGENHILNKCNSIVKNMQNIFSKAQINASIGATIGANAIISKVNIPQYEVGGYPKSASLFWANENGVPELVGNIGNQTAVASGTEITGISNAIYDTAQTEIALLREQNNLLMELLRKDMSVNIGDREIARANARGQKSLGYALIT